jgi:cell division protein FtsQ
VDNSRRRSRKKAVAVFFIVIFIASAAYLLGWSSLFTVKQVSVVGAPTAADEKIIQQTSQITEGEKMARLEPRVVSSSLQKIIWLDHSTITRNWLHGLVVIRVWPRAPVATYRGKLIDDVGNIFELPNFASSTLPIIFAKDHSSAQFAISLLTQLPTTLRSKLVGVEVIGLNSVTLSLRDMAHTRGKVLQVAWGDASEMELKVKVYQALVALPENAQISEIDLSAPHAPIVR